MSRAAGKLGFSVISGWSLLFIGSRERGREGRNDFFRFFSFGASRGWISLSDGRIERFAFCAGGRAVR